jgi:hypothetical protein
MSNHQEKEEGPSGSESQRGGVPSKWARVAAVSAILWMLFSLPLVVMALRFLDVLTRQPGALIGGTWNMDSFMTVGVTIAAPLPILSGIATLVFLSVRSARSRRVAAFSLLLSLLGMTMLVIMGMASVAEGRRTGGHTGMAQVLMSILFGYVLPALISMPGVLGLVSLWRLKNTISEKK